MIVPIRWKAAYCARRQPPVKKLAFAGSGHWASRGLPKEQFIHRVSWKAFLLLGFLLAGMAQIAAAQAVRTNAGFASNSVPRNDDGSSAEVEIGFTVNFFGESFNRTYVNNNGNITFGGSLSAFTPQGLIGSPLRIIAPFWADVDTRAAGSALATFGQDTVDGHRAFGANYINVGYFGTHDDRLNSFQLVLIERGDIGPGNFDIEFNYDRIQWETGDASGGDGGLGGTSASAGYSNGSGTIEGSFEILGSRRNGIFLDSNRNGLIRRKLNSNVRGRLVFFVRDGSVGCTYSALSIDPTFPWEGGPGTVQVAAPSGCEWTATSNSSFISITSGAAGSGSQDVTYLVAPNRRSRKRSGTLTVAGQRIVVTQDPHVTVIMSPPALNLYPLNGVFPTQVALRIESLPNMVNWTASATPLSGVDWRFKLTPSSGTATLLEPSTVGLELTTGFSRSLGEIGTITIFDVDEGTSVVVPVTLVPGGHLQLSQQSFVFRAPAGGPAPLSQSLRIASSGQGTVNWAVPATDLSTAPWLNVSSMSGAISADTAIASSTTLTVDPAGLAPGVYQVLLPVAATGEGFETLLVTATLHVTPADIAPVTEVSP